MWGSPVILLGHCLQHAPRERCRQDPGKRESCGGEQPAKLLDRPLAPSEQHEHVEVIELARMILIAGRHDLFNHQKLCALTHGSAAGLEDADRLLVIPVVDDSLEDVSVRASRHSLEETSTHDLAAVCDTSCPEHCARAFD